jgi:predicted deacetylase
LRIFAENFTHGEAMLSKDFKEFIELLNKHQVKYLIVGGYAVALHGYPRYTKNLDFWIERSHKNASSLLKALDEFGFGSLGYRSVIFWNLI